MRQLSVGGLMRRPRHRGLPLAQRLSCRVRRDVVLIMTLRLGRVWRPAQRRLAWSWRFLLRTRFPSPSKPRCRKCATDAREGSR